MADLTSVLQTLSALSNPAPDPAAQVTRAHEISQHNTFPNDDSYEPPDIFPDSTVPSPSAPPTSQSCSDFTNHRTPDSVPTHHHPVKVENGAVDPSTITSWPAALRYVMRAVSLNEDLQRRVLRLIQNQHDHERKWWEGRQVLLDKQRSRVEKQQQLDEVLRSVGAPVDNTKAITTPEEDRAELYRYDTKVYKASMQMAEALDLELRRLQIPFFVTSSHLVSDVSEPLSGAKSGGNISAVPAPENRQVSRTDLLALRRRMLDLLEDLCKE